LRALLDYDELNTNATRTWFDNTALLAIDIIIFDVLFNDLSEGDVGCRGKCRPHICELVEFVSYEDMIDHRSYIHNISSCYKVK